MRRPIAALAIAVVSASAARGQTIDPDKAQAWLENTFGIKTVRVVEATPDELVTLKTIEPRPPSDFHVIVHLENFRPPDPLEPPSTEQEFFINCPSRRFHVERIESFSEHGARGAQSTSYGPTDWGRPIPNSPEERIVEGVCGPVALAGEVEPESPPKTPPEPKARPAAPIATPRPLAQTAPVQPSKASKPSAARAQLFAGDKAAAQQFVKGLRARLPIMATVAKPQIVEAPSGGHPVYRVQVSGFASPAEAARFCAAVRTAGQDCFVPPEGQR
jgi:hypothetical protein